VKTDSDVPLGSSRRAARAYVANTWLGRNATSAAPMITIPVLMNALDRRGVKTRLKLPIQVIKVLFVEQELMPHVD